MTTNLQIPPEFDDAPETERIAFVEELWNRIAQHPDAVPVPDHHKRILDQRLNAYRRNPEAGRPWSEVRDQLLANLRSS